MSENMLRAENRHCNERLRTSGAALRHMA